VAVAPQKKKSEKLFDRTYILNEIKNKTKEIHCI